MLVIVAILLLFGLVVRHKWRDAAAKKEEILRLVVVASEEEAEIAKLQAVEHYNSPPQPIPQPETPYYCAVCYSHTTTRCSRCKAVRYCSGKCQIIHWRQGHKDDCRPAVAVPASKDSNCVADTASENQFEIKLNDEARICSDPIEELDDSGSSSSSLPSFFSSTESSETSFDASISDVHDSGTLLKPDKASPVGTDSHLLQTTSDSDEADVPSPSSSVNSVSNRPWSNQIEKTLASKIDESHNSTSFKDKRKGDRAAVLEDTAIDKVELNVSQSSSSARTSSAGDWKNQAQLSSSEVIRSTSYRASGNHQMSNVESKFSKSLKMSPSNEYWGNESPLYNGKETRSVMLGSSGNFKKISKRTESHHAIPSEIEGAPMISQHTSKGLKTSVHKFVQQFRAPKQSKSCTYDSVKDGNYNKVIFSPKLFMQLYSFDDVELHPFGLVNCGNRNVVDKMQSICLEEAGVSSSSAEDSTLVGLTFGGYLRSKIKCMKCSWRSERCDPMMDLTVEIDGNIYTLEDALEQFTRSETLGGDDKYKCSRCKSYEKAKKKLTLLEAPNILTIVLKRFRAGNSEKLNKLVQFPEVLNLSPYMSGMSDKYPIYHLYAVIVHLGAMTATYSGHYVSYVKDFRGDWFKIDDSRVSPVDLETVLSEKAYILFYARHSLRGSSFVKHNSMYSDGKTKRSMESISLSNSVKKKSSKTKQSSSLHHESEKYPFWMSANDLTGGHILDSPSDSSSIFSASDAGSYSTDSTKDSSAEEISGYIFGSSVYHS
ncbi:hypothetical protein BUALT_Bualt04G0030400 [Buddleja alternifolia]|uniref:Ubiquitin carboxyl-terminal hydrolase 17 n=1 Tax=Buddleja alternifolia TaxID=168488 RepID=A0AAV6XSP0_9LAMI|nr:hypothetical protein BUALT_Bualt04G0030400 [Buddleja alternifolia]